MCVRKYVLRTYVCSYMPHPSCPYVPALHSDSNAFPYHRAMCATVPHTYHIPYAPPRTPRRAAFGERRLNSSVRTQTFFLFPLFLLLAPPERKRERAQSSVDTSIAIVSRRSPTSGLTYLREDPAVLYLPRDPE